MEFKVGDILNKVDNRGNRIYVHNFEGILFSTEQDNTRLLEYRVVAINQAVSMKYKIVNLTNNTTQHIATEGRDSYRELGRFVLSKKSERNKLIDNLIGDV